MKFGEPSTCFADPLLWNVWALGSPCNAGKLFAASNTFGAIAILQDEQGEPAIGGLPKSLRIGSAIP